MITITRSLARTLRAVLRRAGIKTLGGSGPRVFFHAGADGLCIRAMSPDVAVEYRLAGEFPAEQLAVPLEFLDNCEGKKDELVTLEAQGKAKVCVNWSDRGIPQMLAYDVFSSKPELEFPHLPDNLTSNPPSFLVALRDATTVADHTSTRYALGHLQLRGGVGHIVATDGRQLLRHTGFQFPWADDVLMPASGIFASKELPVDQSVNIGKINGWTSLQLSPWTIWFKLGEGRFPEVRDYFKPVDTALSRFCISPDDAKFLTGTLSVLPDHDDTHHPITLQLDGGLKVRAKSADSPRPTELLLVNSTSSGEAVTINTNRNFLAHALKLGFREACIFAADKPVLCDDGQRQYVWMVLDANSAIKPAADAIHLESPRATTSTVSSSAPTPRRFPVVHKPEERSGIESGSQGGVPSTTKRAARAGEKQRPDTSIAQAENVRAALRQLVVQATELVRSIKRQKRQQRMVENTLSQLKQLGRIAG